MRQKSSRTISRSWHNRGLKCKRNLPFHSGRFLLCCFFLFFLCACFCGLLSRFQLFAGLFVPLVFRVVYAHAGDFVSDRHDGVTQEHAALGAAHLHPLLRARFPDGDEIVLGVHHANHAAITFYQRCGFSDSGRTYMGVKGLQYIYTRPVT